MLAELEQGSSMEDKHQGRLCLTSSGLDATRRSDVERVAAERMLELWLSIIIEEDESKSSKAALASNGAASSSTRSHRQSSHMLFGWRLALARTTKIGDLFDLNCTVLMALLAATTQSTQNKNALQKSASEIRIDAGDERTDWNLHEFIKLQSEEDIPMNGEDLNFW
uniref:AlNc14C162G7808 protein n=1 Tax=Albugo laibachii Nc14 TaxID=890382 RepID=F0WMX3_9STRA|nr:AlNc14C162G7808 [Albugo laibachii Nc14]|eukprot:CCA22658.1 AlNc14C162G7808 [Albugo laibachii Nc14]